ncbi:MAG: reverse transcriptase domain-containing protein, partial [Myxococcota bacterium]
CEIPDGLFEFDPEDVEGFVDPVLQMEKALYGLKQAGYVWLRTYMCSLKSWGFKQCQTDPCIFVKTINGRKLIVAVYVDDTIILHESNADLRWLLSHIGKHYKFHDEGELTWALGMEVGRTPSGHYWIGQQRYIKKMMQLFEPIRKKVTTPLQASLRLDLPCDSPTIDPSTYKRLLGSILYVAVATRPDIAFACSHLARFSTDPRSVHYEQALRVLQFLVNTVDFVITYDRDEDFVGFADASFGNCRKTGKSTTGYVLFYAGGPVLWRSFLQTVVALSTGEAEYMALSPLCKEVIFATQLCTEIDFKAKTPVLLFDDSEPAIAIAMGTGLTKRSRSIRLSFHNVRDCVATNVLTVQKVSGKTNPADILTKPLSSQANGRYCNMFFRRRRK